MKASQQRAAAPYTLWYPPRSLSPVTLQNKLDGLQAIYCMDLTWLWLEIVQQAAANEAVELKFFTVLKSLSYTVKVQRSIDLTEKEPHSWFCNRPFIPDKTSPLMWASKGFFTAYGAIGVTSETHFLLNNWFIWALFQNQNNYLHSCLLRKHRKWNGTSKSTG